MNGLWKLLVAALGWSGFDMFLLSGGTVGTSCLWIKESNFQSNFLMLKSSPVSDLVAEDKCSHQTPCLSLESRAKIMSCSLLLLQARVKLGLSVLENCLNWYLVLRDCLRQLSKVAVVVLSNQYSVAPSKQDLMFNPPEISGTFLVGGETKLT